MGAGKGAGRLMGQLAIADSPAHKPRLRFDRGQLDLPRHTVFEEPPRRHDWHSWCDRPRTGRAKLLLSLSAPSFGSAGASPSRLLVLLLPAQPQ